MNENETPEDQTPEKPEGTLRPGSFNPGTPPSVPNDEDAGGTLRPSSGTPGAAPGASDPGQSFIPTSDEFSLSDELEIPEAIRIGDSVSDDDDVSQTISAKNMSEEVQQALSRVVDSLSESEHEAIGKVDGSTVDLRHVLNVQNHVIKGKLSGIIAYEGDGPDADDTTRSLRVWSVASGKEVLSLKDLPDDMSVTFSPDSKSVAVAGQAASVQIFDAESGTQRLVLTGHDAKVLCVAFSPDGKHIATGSRDLTVRIWDVKTGEQQTTLTGHTEEILHLSYNTDGTVLASSSRDTTVRLWDPASGKNTSTLEGHSDNVYGVEFSPDGSRILSWAQVDPRPELEILGEIGRGAMGVVYDAQQTSLNRKLAIKTLKPGSGTTVDNTSGSERASSFQEDRKLRDMFISEAVITANLVHPNIVPVHNLGQTEDSKLFYSMKLVEGDSWKKVIGTNSLDDNLEILMKMADGVAFAHSKGVINRDLKPENVHTGGFGEVMVLDWGLAITTNEFRQKNSVRTHSDSFGGSPPYMAPEQAIQGQVHRIGYHTDIYLLGAILFQVITGRAPHHFPEFDSLSRMDAIGEILLAAFNNNIIEATDQKGELMDIALKAMATDPEDRYATVEHFQAALGEYQTIGRADEILQNALISKDETGYADYQKAVALYSEAARDGDNKRATDGLERANLAYASLAHQNKDFDLGLQVIEDNQGQEPDVIRKKLRKGQTRRKLLTVTTLAALAVSVGLLVLSFILGLDANSQRSNAAIAIKEANAAKDAVATAKADAVELEAAKIQAVADANHAEADKETAISAKADAEAARQNAETAMAMAVKARTDAEMKKDDAEQKAQAAEQAKAMAVMLTAQAERAKSEAEEKKQAAEQAEELARVSLETTEFQALTSDLSNQVREGDYQNAIQTIEKLKTSETVKKSPGQLKEFQWLEDQLKTSNTAPSDAAFVTPGFVVVADASNARTNLEGWGIEDGELKKQLTLPVGDSGQPVKICTTQDGKTVALFDQQKLHVVNADREATSVDFAQCSVAKFDTAGTKLICGSRDGVLQVFDPQTLESKLKLDIDQRATYEVTDVHWDDSQNQQSIFVILKKGRQTLCGAFPLTDSKDGLKAGEFQQLEFPQDYRPSLSNIAFNSDGTLLALNDLDSANLIILPRKNNDKGLFPFRSPLEMAASEWKFNLPAVVGKHPKITATAGRSQDVVTHLAFGANTNRIVTSCDDSTVRVWEFSNGSLAPAFISNSLEENRLIGHANAITACAFSGAADDRILTTSLDGTVRIWDISDNGGSYKNLRRKILDTSEAAAAQAEKIRAAARKVPEVSLIRPVLRFLVGSLTMMPQAPVLLPQKKTEQPQPDAKTEERLVGAASAVAFHPGNSTFVSAGYDRRATIWPTDGWDGTKKQQPSQQFIEGHRFGLNDMKFSPDGNHLFTSSYDGSLIIWDSKNDADGIGREVARVEQLGLSNAFAISPDGTTVVTSSFKEVGEETSFGATVWQTDQLLSGQTPEPQFELFNVHEARVTAIEFSPDGKSIATADRDGTIVIWKDGTRSAGFPKFNDGVSTLRFVDSNRLLAASFDEGQLAMIDVSGTASFPTIRTYATGESDFVWKLEVSPDGKQFVASTIKTDSDDDDKPVSATLKVEAWDVEEKQPSASLGKAHVFEEKKGGVADAYRHGLTWTEDGTQVAFVINGTIQLFDAKDWTRTTQLRDPSDKNAVRPAAAAFQPKQDDKTLATYDGRNVRLWKFQPVGSETEAIHVTSFRPSARIVAANFSADGNYLITGSRNLAVYDVTTGKSVLRIQRTDDDDKERYLHSGVLTWVEFTPEDGSTDFLSTGQDNVLRIWDWTPGSDEKPDCTVLAHEDGSRLRQAHWGPSGQQVVTITYTGKALLWDTKTRKSIPLDLPADQQFDFQCCAFSKGEENGNWLVAGGRNTLKRSSSAVIWNVVDGKPTVHSIVEAAEHGNQGITAATFTRENRLVTGGTRGALIKWEFKGVATSKGNQPRQAQLLFPLVDFSKTGTDRGPTAHRGKVTSLTTASDGTIASSGEDTVHIWN